MPVAEAGEEESVLPLRVAEREADTEPAERGLAVFFRT
jgi:hypothetical protein